MRIAGTTVLLTGATGGIGQTLARAFAAKGAKLLLTGRREEVLRPLAERLGGQVIVADLAERAGQCLADAAGGPGEQDGRAGD
ncbi:SDR family NAD(P)-dependent oxidoreductase, partial [Streptomyces asiaticus]